MRVLVVDDSAFMRKVISRIIDAAPDMEVVGQARNGREGVEMAQRLLPDLITLDIEMPELDGLGALRQIRIKCRALAPGVVMCSSLTTGGSAEALRALRLGAADVIAKDPAAVGGGDSGFAEELVGKLRVVGAERARAARVSSAPGPGTPLAPPRAATPAELGLSRIAAVVVGASTGGPPALEDVFALLPAGLRTPIFVAQHMPALFTRSLAARLGQHCACPVRLVTDTALIEGGGVYVAEGGRHMRVDADRGGRVRASMTAEPVSAVFRPSVDVLFDTASAAYAGRVLAVQLTGMGSDGRRGAELVRERGGRVIAQHGSTCVVYGMPRAVVDAGLADAVMTPAQIAGLLRTLGTSGPAGVRTTPGDEDLKRSA